MKHFPQERRKLLGKWFADCAKGKRPVGKETEEQLLRALEESLKEVGGERGLRSGGGAI